MILSNFPENCMRSRNVWAVGGRALEAPLLDPPLPKTSILPVKVIIRDINFLKLLQESGLHSSLAQLNTKKLTLN